MKTPDPAASPSTPSPTNGSGAAAILSAGIGSFVLALLAFAADKSANIKSVLIFYKPTGALSGVTTSAILIWLLIWAILEVSWKDKSVAIARVGVVAFALLALSFLLTFPPIVDLF